MSGDPNPIQQAEALIVEGRLEEALALTRPLADAGEPGHPALTTHASILKGLGRHEEALPYNLKATERFAKSPVAWHNLAATLGDMGRGAEARAAIEKSLQMGNDAAVSWGVYARALLAVGALEAAETAYQQCLKRAPAYNEAAVEYANLVWMRRGDLREAQSVLDAAMAGGGTPHTLVIATAKLLDAAGEGAQAADLLQAAVERLSPSATLSMAAAHAAVEAGALDRAQALAELAVTQAPDRPEALNQLSIVQLARGQADLALATARRGPPGIRSMTSSTTTTGWWASTTSRRRRAGARWRTTSPTSRLC
jgi:tetratricopeptide (TPR) repeat protein